MKILHEKPPEWIMQGCLSQFRINVERTFWTYGDILYNPGGIDLPDHVIAHEEQHKKQQAAYIASKPLPLQKGDVANYSPDDKQFRDGKDGWWSRYLADPRFRLEQEAEAYGAEHRFFCKRVTDRNQRARFLHLKAQQLSSPLYQVAVTHQQASDMIAVLAGQKALPKAAQPPKLEPVT